MIRELDIVALTHDLPEDGLKAGDVGTVVLNYDDNKAFEVEFVMRNGRTAALLTLLPSDIERVGSARLEERVINGSTIHHLAKLRPEE